MNHISVLMLAKQFNSEFVIEKVVQKAYEEFKETGSVSYCDVDLGKYSAEILEDVNGNLELTFGKSGSSKTIYITYPVFRNLCNISLVSFKPTKAHNKHFA